MLLNDEQVSDWSEKKLPDHFYYIDYNQFND